MVDVAGRFSGSTLLSAPVERRWLLPSEGLFDTSNGVLLVVETPSKGCLSVVLEPKECFLGVVLEPNECFLGVVLEPKESFLGVELKPNESFLIGSFVSPVTVLSFLIDLFIPLEGLFKVVSNVVTPFNAVAFSTGNDSATELAPIILVLSCLVLKLGTGGFLVRLVEGVVAGETFLDRLAMVVRTGIRGFGMILCLCRLSSVASESLTRFKLEALVSILFNLVC